MNIWTFIQIEFIPFLALALTLYISAIEFKSYRNVRKFQIMVAMIMCILVVDGFNWFTVLKPMAMPLTVIWISNILYFLLTEIIAYTWFQYVCRQIYSDCLNERQQRLMKLSLIPLAAVCLIIVTSPWNQLIFSINPVDHTYTRGNYHYIQMLVGFMYLLLASALAFMRSFKVTLTEQKKECRFLAYIVILPFIGGTLQIINYSFVFLWSFTAASAFLIFIDFQSHLISVDMLTSLNNRGNLEFYLQQKARNRDTGWYLFMMDVDRFKYINDRYGHIEGDLTLKLVAQALRNVFGASGGFLARYGGDEFVVIAERIDPDSACVRCNEELLRQAAERKLPYEIHLSIGYARCERAEADAYSELMKSADRMMYEVKTSRRNQV